MTNSLRIPRELIYFGGTAHPDWISEELMLAQLLIDEVVFINNVHWSFNLFESCDPQVSSDSYKGPTYSRKLGVDPKHDTICCYVSINDVFTYGADGLEVTVNELRSLYEHHMDFNKEYKGWGVIIWAIKKTKDQPIPKVLESLGAAGLWTKDLERLVEIKTTNIKYYETEK